MFTIKPMHINTLRIPSNFFFAPINPGFSKNGEISKQFIDFFVKRSGKSIGICYVGNVALNLSYASNKRTVILSNNRIETWKRMVEQIESNGSIAGIQLAWKPSQIEPQKEFYSNDIDYQIKVFKNFYDSFNEYDKMIVNFVENVKKAIDAGFKIIQIHAAHGYALSLLLSSTISNHEEPEDTKGLKLLEMIMEKLVAYKDRVVFDIRVSLYEGISDKKSEFIYKEKLMERIGKLGFDMISLSNGLYNIDKNMIYPRKSDGMVILEEAIILAEKNPSIIWNVAGNMERLLNREIDKTIPNNLSFSIGRQLICDPLAIEKASKQIAEKIVNCTECNRCHYFSYGLEGIQKCIIDFKEDL